jgi:hypothetical protein
MIATSGTWTDVMKRAVINLEDYREEKLSKLNNTTFISKGVISEGTLVITCDNKSITILTRPYNRPHFGLSTWICCGLVDESIQLVYIQHLSYMKTRDFKVLNPDERKGYQKPLHVIK